MNRVWFIADTHFGHRNVVHFEGDRFSSMEDRENYIINQWNKVVKDNDLVYILGDFAIRLPEQDMKDMLSKLKGRKILIYGNHDKLSAVKYKQIGFEDAIRGPVFIENHKIILSHEPAPEAYNNKYVINLYRHTHLRKVLLPNYFNVCACQIGYKPIGLNRFIKYVQEVKQRREKFGEEWYYKYLVEEEKNE